MLRNLGLNNPFPPVYQVAYPNNIYKVESRHITVLEDTTKVNVEIFISVYPDSSELFRFMHPPIYYVLKNLPNDEAQLGRALYESELQLQHPDEILDGTALKDFIIVP
jgi:hypothetical protein